ncbi:MAG: pirin family protein [Kiloniellales bacterium]|nr:pirin family protein [Kiloniellales bacterium]
MAETIIRLIDPRSRDLGGFEVRRILPIAKQRMVGPFVFYDHLGPAVFQAGKGIDVRPHPHIGLATVTYLFEGELMHRDSLGFAQQIRPGDVNWMTAGRGIVHSERSSPDARDRDLTLHAIQSWVALPQSHEETEPSFHHHGGETLPSLEIDGVRLRLIAGSAYGETSPVKVFSPTFYLAAEMPAGSRLTLPSEHEERAVHVADGVVSVQGQTLSVGQMAVFVAGAEITVQAEAESLVMLLGGAAMDGERHIWWNFVSSSKDRIEQAKADWKEGRFDAVPGESEFIPLPED